MYKRENIVKLSDTDAAGILFFANFIRLSHDIYDEFIRDIGFSLNYIINEADYFLLIAHTEADYKKALKLGEKYSVALKVEKIGKTSFTLSYEIHNGDGDLSALIKTVHVAVDKKSNRPIRLADELRVELKNYCCV